MSSTFTNKLKFTRSELAPTHMRSTYNLNNAEDTNSNDLSRNFNTNSISMLNYFPCVGIVIYFPLNFEKFVLFNINITIKKVKLLLQRLDAKIPNQNTNVFRIEVGYRFCN